MTLSVLAVFLVLIILDGYNPVAGYLNSNVTKVFDLFVIGLSAATAVRLVRRDWANGEEQAAKPPEKQKMNRGGKSNREKR